MHMEKSSSEMDLPASNFPSGSQTEEDSAWEDCKSLSTVETRPSMTPRERQASPAPRIDGRMHSTSSGTEGMPGILLLPLAFGGKHPSSCQFASVYLCALWHNSKGCKSISHCVIGA